MPVRTLPPTATGFDRSLDTPDSRPDRALRAVLNVLSCKAPLVVTVGMARDIFSAATNGVLIGYAARANAGSTVGGLIGEIIGLIRGCAKAAKERRGLQLEEVADWRAEKSKRVSRGAEHGPDSDKVKALVPARR